MLKYLTILLRKHLIEKYLMFRLRVIICLFTEQDVFNEPVSTHILDLFHDELFDGMELATERYCLKNKKVFKPVLGENEFCKDKYSASRTAFLLWLQGGTIRLGDLDYNAILTRKMFTFVQKTKRKHRIFFCRTQPYHLKVCLLPVICWDPYQT